MRFLLLYKLIEAVQFCVLTEREILDIHHDNDLVSGCFTNKRVTNIALYLERFGSTTSSIRALLEPMLRFFALPAHTCTVMLHAKTTHHVHLVDAPVEHLLVHPVEQPLGAQHAGEEAACALAVALFEQEPVFAKIDEKKWQELEVGLSHDNLAIRTVKDRARVLSADVHPTWPLKKTHTQMFDTRSKPLLICIVAST